MPMDCPLNPTFCAPRAETHRWWPFCSCLCVFIGERDGLEAHNAFCCWLGYPSCCYVGSFELWFICRGVWGDAPVALFQPDLPTRLSFQLPVPLRLNRFGLSWKALPVPGDLSSSLEPGGCRTPAQAQLSLEGVEEPQALFILDVGKW